LRGLLSAAGALRQKIDWHGNRWLLRNLWLLNLIGGRLTVIDHFGTPGDTLLTSSVCQIVKQRWPRLLLNCVTKNPDLIEYDPAITEINGPVGQFRVSFEYLGLVVAKAASKNVLAPCLNNLGIWEYEYKARVYLTETERRLATQRVPTGRPIISINVMSKELTKVWKLDRWAELIHRLSPDFAIVQLGDDKEPDFPGVISYGGKLSKRESMAILSLARVHIGPDSFLMHAANGLDVPSVIIYGGSRPSACLGYNENRNLYVQIACAPCWIHTTTGGACSHSMQCMEQIGVDQVLDAVLEQAAVWSRLEVSPESTRRL
jgi:Glycosyltransferase family 9 (heptosyltransferase)